MAASDTSKFSSECEPAATVILKAGVSNRKNMPFGGLRVLSLESRRAKEMEALIRREGGEPFVAPSVEERAARRPC